MFIITSIPLPIAPSSIVAVASSIAAPSVACTLLRPSSPASLPCPPFLPRIGIAASAPRLRRLDRHPSAPGSTARTASGAAVAPSCYPGGSLAAGCCSSAGVGTLLVARHNCSRFGPRIGFGIAKVAVAAALRRVQSACWPFCGQLFLGASFSRKL